MEVSIVDLSPIIPEQTRHDALQNSIEVAQHIEKLGFKRIWVAEHHNTAWIAGRAPQIMIAAIAAKTPLQIERQMLRNLKLFYLCMLFVRKPKKRHKDKSLL